jgi:hypothetical protein
VRANFPTVIAQGWCATTQNILNQNMQHISYNFFLDGTPLDLKNLQVVEGPAASNVCRRFVGIIRNWPEGQHVIRITRHQDMDLNDGANDIKAGDYVNVFNITVLPPIPLSLPLVVEPYDAQTMGTFPTLRELSHSVLPTEDGFGLVREILLTADQPAVLTNSWCATTADFLAQNLQHLKFFYEVDGAPLNLTNIQLLDSQTPDGYCHGFASLIRSWTEGRHNIIVTMRLDAQVDDGSGPIEAGDYLYVYHVIVMPPK